MVRPDESTAVGSCASELAGESPVRVSVGAPGTRDWFWGTWLAPVALPEAVHAACVNTIGKPCAGKPARTV